MEEAATGGRGGEVIIVFDGIDQLILYKRSLILALKTVMLYIKWPFVSKTGSCLLMHITSIDTSPIAQIYS